MPVPVVDETACQHCGKCGEICQYGALTVLQSRILFFPELCHSCGGCTLVCPNDAIHEEPKRIGTLSISAPQPGLKLISGTLETEARTRCRLSGQQRNRQPAIIWLSSTRPRALLPGR